MKKMKLSTRLTILLAGILLVVLFFQAVVSNRYIRDEKKLEALNSTSELYQTLKETKSFRHISLEPFSSIRISFGGNIQILRGERYEAFFSTLLPEYTCVMDGNILNINQLNSSNRRSQLYIFLPEEPDTIGLFQPYSIDCRIFGFTGKETTLMTGSGSYTLFTDMSYINLWSRKSDIRLHPSEEYTTTLDSVSLQVWSDSASFVLEDQKSKYLNAAIHLNESKFHINVHAASKIGNMTIEGSLVGRPDENTFYPTRYYENKSTFSYPSSCDSLIFHLTCPEGKDHRLELDLKKPSGYEEIGISKNISLMRKLN